MPNDVSEITTLEDMGIYPVDAADTRLNVLLYGRPGVGKTTMAATAQNHPSMSNVLFLNIEGGLLSVAGRGDLHSVVIRSVAQLEDILWKFANQDPLVSQFNTLVLDSGTELQTISLEGIVAARMERASGARRTRDMNDVNVEDYGKNTTQLKRLFRMMRDLPIHVIITALPRTSNTEGTGAVSEVGPEFTPKVQEAVMGYMDFVWYMYVDANGNRVCLTREKGVYRAKTRGANFADAIGESVANPNLADLFDLLLDTETAETLGQARATDPAYDTPVDEGVDVADEILPPARAPRVVPSEELLQEGQEFTSVSDLEETENNTAEEDDFPFIVRDDGNYESTEDGSVWMLDEENNELVPWTPVEEDDVNEPNLDDILAEDDGLTAEEVAATILQSTNAERPTLEQSATQQGQSVAQRLRNSGRATTALLEQSRARVPRQTGRQR